MPKPASQSGTELRAYQVKRDFAVTPEPPPEAAGRNRAIGSYCPRARPGATAATPLAWREVTPQLDPAGFTIKTIPERLDRPKRDPWRDFFRTEQTLPEVASGPARRGTRAAKPAAASRPGIVVARKPRPR